MIELLEEMSKEPDGRMLFSRHMGMSESERVRAAHAEPLRDVLDEPKEDARIRASNSDKDLSRAFNQNRPFSIPKHWMPLHEGTEPAEQEGGTIDFSKVAS